MKAPLSYVPALPATAGVIAGILLYSLGYCTISITVCLVAFGVLYAVRLHFWAFCCLFTGLGLIISIVHSPNALPHGLFDGKHTVYGTVVSVKETPTATNYTIDIDSVKGCRIAKVRCRVSVLSATGLIRRGSYVTFGAELSPIESDTDLPHEVDYSRYLRSAGIQCRCTLPHAGMTVLRVPGRLDNIACDIHDCMYNAIVTSPLDGATSAFLLAVILGDDSMLLPDVRDAFRSVGIAHVLALSGMHVGIIAMLLVILLFPLQGTIRGHNIRAVITVLLIWAYTAIVGFTPSIVRAAVMLTVFNAAWLIQRGYRAFNSLLLSILIILCIEPAWLYTPGFQLSVCAVASILAFCWLIPKKLRKHRLAYFAVNTIGIPVAAMLGTAMVSMYYFGAFPFMFLISNIIAGFLFPPILMGGTILMLLNLCGIKFGFLGFCICGLYHIMDSAITWLASVSWAVADGLYFDGRAILPYMLTTVLLVLSVKRLSSVRLWLLTLISSLLTVITLLLTAEHIPVAELYVTRTRPTRMVMRHHDKAWLWTDSRDTIGQISECNDRYSRFLKSRHCGTFLDIDSATSAPMRRLGRRVLMADTLTICIIYDDTIPKVIGSRADYALICRGYKGTVADVVSATGADTVLIAANVHPKVRKRLVGECADTIPHIDLRATGLSKVWP